MPEKRRVLVLALLCLLVAPARGQVVRLEILSRETPALEGVSFGTAGTYERIRGRVHGEVNPADPKNGLITDLERAPMNAHGRVEYAADFVLLKPVDMARSDGILRYLAPNRGWPFPDADSVSLARGTVFLWSAWQGDVPQAPGRLTLDVPVAVNPDGSPITGPVRVEFVGHLGAPAAEMPLQGNAYNTGQMPYPPARLDNAGAVLTRRVRETDTRIFIPNADWAFAACDDGPSPFPGRPDPSKVCLKGGFQPQYLYEAKDPRVLGLGLAAVRDAVAFFRHGTADVQGNPNPLDGHVRYAMGTGVSQAGNFMKTFVHLGFNADLEGGRVFDALFPLVAARQTNVNMRLEAWTVDGTLPPDSRVPGVAGGTLVHPEALHYPAMRGVSFPVRGVRVPVPDFEYRAWYNSLGLLDFGPRFDETDETGIADWLPPAYMGKDYAVLVPSVDEDGNEVAGVQPVGNAVPLGTNLPYNYDAHPAFSDLFWLSGSFIPFHETRAERLAAGDERRSLEERYGDHAGYVSAVRRAAEGLVADGFLLPEDAAHLVAEAEASGVLKPVERTRAPEIEVLSTRADLVSGGNALVEIRLAVGADTAATAVNLNGIDVSDAFAVRANGRLLGLVTGLREGTNELRAAAGGETARLAMTNHPGGGPVISGPQVQPWTCQTTAEPSLGPALDDQCNAPTRYRYVYRTTAGTFAGYDPDAPAPADLTVTRTDAGVTVPYVVRIERGTMNRGLHEIAVLYDPSKPWAPWAPQPQWNGKLLVLYGHGTSQQYRQGLPESVLHDEALSREFAVVSSSMLSNGQHANFVTAAETTMMLKEHVVETYGPIRYTIGQGGSGGALLQHLIADSYPGLLDGLRTTFDWEDSISGAYREFADSALLLRAFEHSTLAYTDDARGSIGGWGAANTGVFTIESRRVGDYNRPDDGTRCAGADSYDAETNPTGVRCTFQDFMASVLGRRPEDGFAPVVFDNVGVQYGLLALREGRITPGQFVDVNARVGGYDVNGRWQPERSAMNAASAALLHRTGQVTYGLGLGRVPEIAVRSTDNSDYHYPFRTYVNRSRLIAANGHADNHVFWTAPPATRSTLDAMDSWLAAVEADSTNDPPERKVVRNRPSDVATACWIDGLVTTDVTACDAVYPYFREPRTVAGDTPAIYTMKCRLKPLRREDYPVVFTDAQWVALERAFPDGVCDFSRPGVGFQPNVPWLTYTDGPGGQPLGEPPASEPVR